MLSVTRKIAEGTILFSSNNLVSKVARLIVTLYLVRTIGMYDFGLLTLALATFTIGSMFLDLGIGAVVTTDVARMLSEKRLDLAKTLLIRYSQIEVVMSIVLFVIVFFSSSFVELGYTQTVADLVKICAFLLLFGGLKNIFVVTFNSHAKFRYVSFIQVVESLAMLPLAYILVSVMNLGVSGAMSAYPLATLVSIVLSCPMLIKTAGHFQKIEKVKEDLFLRLVKGHGKWILALNPLKRVGDNITPWIIKFFLGVESVAIFSVAYRLFVSIQSVISSLEQTLMPITSMEISNPKTVQNILNRSIKYAIWICVPLIILLWVSAPLLLELLFTDKYLASVPIFRILLLTLLIFATGSIFRPLFYALKAQKYLFYSYLMWLLSILAVEVIFIQLFGLIGIAYAKIVSGVIIFIFRYYFIKKISDFKINVNLRIDDFDRKMLSKIVGKIKRD